MMAEVSEMEAVEVDEGVMLLDDSPAHPRARRPVGAPSRSTAVAPVPCSCFGLFYGWVILAAVIVLDCCTAPGHSTGPCTVEAVALARGLARACVSTRPRARVCRATHPRTPRVRRPVRLHGVVGGAVHRRLRAPQCHSRRGGGRGGWLQVSTSSSITSSRTSA